MAWPWIHSSVCALIPSDPALPAPNVTHRGGLHLRYQALPSRAGSGTQFILQEDKQTTENRVFSMPMKNLLFLAPCHLHWAFAVMALGIVVRGSSENQALGWANESAHGLCTKQAKLVRTQAKEKAAVPNVGTHVCYRSHLSAASLLFSRVSWKAQAGCMHLGTKCQPCLPAHHTLCPWLHGRVSWANKCCRRFQLQSCQVTVACGFA